MSAPLEIRHLSAGPLAGRVQQLSGITIRIGRHPDNDVVFDAEQHGMVSGHHAELRIADGTVLIADVGSRNGTLVNGTRIQKPVSVGASDRIRLGDDGPEFTAGLQADTMATQASAPTASTVPPGRGVGEQTMMRAILQATRRERRRTLAIVGTLALTGTTVAWFATRPAADQGQPTSIGAAPDREPAGGARPAAGPDHAPAGTVADAHQQPAAVDATTPGPPPTPPEWTEVLRRAAESVYLVVRSGTIQGEHVEQAFGTAWAVAPGVLCTNAHIAAEHGAARTTIFVRSSSAEPRDLAIATVELHPGFELCRQLLARYRPFDANTGAFLNLEPGFDVALLRIAAADREHVAPPLALADATALQQLVAGQPLASIGFPKEGMQGGGTDLRRPEPTTDIKPLTRMSDVLFAKAAFDDALNLSYGFVAVGGSSGSPVLDRDGRVIGLIATGNVVVSGASSRNAVDGSCHGPRSDLARELLDGSATDRQARRATALEQAMGERFLAGTATPRLFARSLVRQVLNDSGKNLRSIEDIEIAGEAEARLDGSGATVDVGPLRVPSADSYRLLAFCRDLPLQPIVRLRQAGSIWSDDLPAQQYWWLSAPLRLQPDRPLDVRLRLAKSAGEPATRVAVLLLREN